MIFPDAGAISSSDDSRAGSKCTRLSGISPKRCRATKWVELISAIAWAAAVSVEPALETRAGPKGQGWGRGG